MKDFNPWENGLRRGPLVKTPFTPSPESKTPIHAIDISNLSERKLLELKQKLTLVLESSRPINKKLQETLIELHETKKANEKFYSHQIINSEAVRYDTQHLIPCIIKITSIVKQYLSQVENYSSTPNAVVPIMHTLSKVLLELLGVLDSSIRESDRGAFTPLIRMIGNLGVAIQNRFLTNSPAALIHSANGCFGYAEDFPSERDKCRSLISHFLEKAEEKRFEEKMLPNEVKERISDNRKGSTKRSEGVDSKKDDTEGRNAPKSFLKKGGSYSKPSTASGSRESDTQPLTRRVASAAATPLAVKRVPPARQEAPDFPVESPHFWWTKEPMSIENFKHICRQIRRPILYDADTYVDYKLDSRVKDFGDVVIDQDEFFKEMRTYVFENAKKERERRRAMQLPIDPTCQLAYTFNTKTYQQWYADEVLKDTSKENSHIMPLVLPVDFDLEEEKEKAFSEGVGFYGIVNQRWQEKLGEAPDAFEVRKSVYESPKLKQEERRTRRALPSQLAYRG